jgi:phosphoribosyl-ATP pyrophosphohydrolase
LVIIHTLTPYRLIAILLDRSIPEKRAEIAPKPVKYTGLSLSFCVQDVIRGRVAEESIEKIIAATCMRSDEVFEEVIAEYAHGHWMIDGKQIRLPQKRS